MSETKIAGYKVLNPEDEADFYFISKQEALAKHHQLIEEIGMSFVYAIIEDESGDLLDDEAIAVCDPRYDERWCPQDCDICAQNEMK